MTREDIIRMAHEADCLDPEHYGSLWADKLERFAALVAAVTEQEMRESGWRQCAKGQRTTQFCGQLEAEREKLKSLYDQIRFDEREECAKLVDANADACVMNSTAQMVLRSNAAAIRARGEK